ncbi:MAG TPA: YciI family protein [Vicinamibacterales bacterium]
MQQYLLTIYQPDGDPPPPPVLERVMRDVNALLEEAKQTGAWVFNGGLHPPDTSTVVRVEADNLLVTDGPYIEGKEHVGGFMVVKAPDLDGALTWARKLAQALAIDQGGVRSGLPIEVRPFNH